MLTLSLHFMLNTSCNHDVGDAAVLCEKYSLLVVRERRKMVLYVDLYSAVTLSESNALFTNHLVKLVQHQQ